MNIVERGKAFVQSLVSIANRTAWQWRRCPYCGSTATSKWGSCKRRPWYLDGRREVVVARHRCCECGRTYSEESAQLRRRCRYAREVRRQAIDYWVHMGCSTRKVAEWVRSQMGKQERYLIWRVLEERKEKAERCWLCASTVGRWLDEAGVEAQESVCGQLEGLGKVRALAADGLWAWAAQCAHSTRGGERQSFGRPFHAMSRVSWMSCVIMPEGVKYPAGRWTSSSRKVASARANLRKMALSVSASTCSDTTTVRTLLSARTRRARAAPLAEANPAKRALLSTNTLSFLRGADPAPLESHPLSSLSLTSALLVVLAVVALPFLVDLLLDLFEAHPRLGHYRGHPAAMLPNLGDYGTQEKRPVAQVHKSQEVAFSQAVLVSELLRYGDNMVTTPSWRIWTVSIARSPW